MPIEEIRRIQQAREAQATRERTARGLADERARLTRVEAERQQRAAEQQRRQFIAQQTKKILKLSGALKGLQRINKEMLEGNTSKHSLSYSPENGMATLAWGNGFKECADGSVQPEGYDFNYSYITLWVDPDKETLTIEGQRVLKIDRNGWKDTGGVERALALAYVDPRVVVPRGDNDGYDAFGGGPNY